MIEKNISNSKKITFVLFLLFFLVGTLTYKDYGISIDEEFQRSSGLYWLKYVLEFTPFEELSREVADKFAQSKGFTVSHVEDHPFYGVIFDLPAAFLEVIFKINDPKNYFHLKHFLTFILFFVGVIFFYKTLLNRFANYRAALIGGLFFILSPRIYGNSFYNPKDIIFLSLLSISIYFCFKLFDKMNYKNFLLFAFFTALSTSQRMYGIFLPLSFIGFYFLSVLSKKEDIKYIKGVIFFCFTFLLFLTLFWPYLWSNPFMNFIEAYKYFSHHSHLTGIKMLFNSDYIRGDSVPYSYIITWISITTPVLYVFLFIIGYFYILKRFFLKFVNIKTQNYYYDLWRSKKEKKDLFILFNFTCIIFYLILFDVSIFTGWRHLYFNNIFIIYIATYSLYLTFFNSNLKTKQNFILSIISLYLIFISYKMIIYHPYQNIYFNSFFNKTKSIHEKFEVDYWGLSGNKFLKEVLEIEKDKNYISVASASYVPLERSKKLLNEKDRKKIKIVGQDYQNADYIYTNFMSEVDKKYNDKYKIPPNFSKINTFAIDNVVVYEVYKKN